MLFIKKISRIFKVGLAILLITVFSSSYFFDAHIHVKNLFYSESSAADIDNTIIMTKSFTHKVETINGFNAGNDGNLSINYVRQDNMTQNEGRITIIGVHGTPGSWSAWEAVMATDWVHNNTDFIAIDRPGWGKSRVTVDGKDTIIYDITEQAEITAALIREIKKQNPAQPIALMGHSWGAPVIAKVSADNPDLVDALVIIGGPFQPETMAPRWYHKWAKNFLIKSIIGRDLRQSNLEMLPLEAQLEILKNDWKKIKVPVIIIQGKKDYLVDYSNAEYLNNQLTQSQSTVVLLEDNGHFFPFSDPEIIIDAIQKLPEQLHQ